MMSRLRSPLLALLLLLLVAPAGPAGDGDKAKPKLVVLLVFDQMRGDYPERWLAQFGDKGFKRLMKEGAWFKNCHYPYANTVTAVGHAALVTGCSPNKHGIVGNNWYDRATKRLITDIGDEKYRQLPEPAKLPKATLGVSPKHRLAPSVGDALRAASPKSKIVSLSLKPRSASLMAAILQAVAFWFSEHTGGFVTSTYYTDAPPEWVDRFNARKLPDSWFGKEWTRFNPKLDYEALSGPDDAKGEEAKSYGFGRTFPHPVNGKLKAPGTEFYSAVEATPFGNDLLYQFALAAVDGEKLGQDETPDLLLVSFSSNDLVGHLYGPDSQEVLDMTLRTDALIGDLLDQLDAKVGKGRYAVVLSADHGVCPLPEASHRAGRDAGRIENKVLRRDVELVMQFIFGASDEPYIEEMVPPCIYFDQRTLAHRKLAPADAERKLAALLPKYKGIQAAYTRTELTKGTPADKLGAMAAKSFHPERSGDVFLVTKPYWFISSYTSGTTHGSPHPYDTHVPLFVFGPAIRAGSYEEPVTPQAAAAILGRFLSVGSPKMAEADVPKALK